MAKKKKLKGKKKKGVTPYDPWYHPTTITRAIPKPLGYKSASARMSEIFAKAILILMLILTLLTLFLAMLGEEKKISQNDNAHDTEYTSVQCQGGEN